MVLALFLIPLLMGLVDVSRLLFTRIAVQDAAQEGAMFYAFEPTATDATAQAHAIGSIENPALDPGSVSAECAPVVRDAGDFGLVTVGVEHEVELIFPFLGDTVTIAREAQAERFYPCPGP